MTLHLLQGKRSEVLNILICIACLHTSFQFHNFSRVFLSSILLQHRLHWGKSNVLYRVLQTIAHPSDSYEFLTCKKVFLCTQQRPNFVQSLVFTTDLRAFLQHRPNILTNLEDLPNKLFGTFIAHFVTPLFLHFAISQFFCKTLNSSDILTYNMPLIHTFFTCSRWNMAYSFFYQTYIHHKEIKFLQEGFFCY